MARTIEAAGGVVERDGLIAFGSADPEGFVPQMGSELVGFLARVFERIAERWPIS